MPDRTIRTFDHREVSPSELLADKGTTTISVCLPARDEAPTVGPIVAALRRELVDEVPLLDELVVLDDHSTDATARCAADAGARVVAADSVLPHLCLGPGKGQALWKSLLTTSGDLVVWCDADIRDFDTHLVTGVIRPLLRHRELAFVKGFYERPLGEDATGGGRVTELVARPALSLLFPELAAVIQPLAGEYGGRREVLEQIPFVGGYGVEIGLLIDIVERHGTAALAQVDLGRRVHRNRSLSELGPQAATVLATALGRAAPEVIAGNPSLVRPGTTPTPIELVELPSVASLPRLEDG